MCNCSSKTQNCFKLKYFKAHTKTNIKMLYLVCISNRSIVSKVEGVKSRVNILNIILTNFYQSDWSIVHTKLLIFIKNIFNQKYKPIQYPSKRKFLSKKYHYLTKERVKFSVDQTERRKFYKYYLWAVDASDQSLISKDWIHKK